MKVLVTGFTPFGGEIKNPAFEAVKLMADKIGDAEIVKVEISTAFYQSVKNLKAQMKKIQPDCVICVGQAGGRANISIERVAINMDDARIADNEGNQPIDLPIVVDGPAAYFSNLPIKAISKRIQDAGIPAGVSNSAGTYVCNHLMYGLMHLIQTEFQTIKGGFIHVPFCEEQVVDKPNMPSMHLSSIAKALEIAVETAINVKTDYLISEGSEC